MPAVGDRVKMTGVMHGDPDPLPVGLKGTVVGLNPGSRSLGSGQIYVDWDVIEGQGRRSLILLEDDPFTVIKEET